MSESDKIYIWNCATEQNLFTETNYVVLDAEVRSLSNFL